MAPGFRSHADAARAGNVSVVSQTLLEAPSPLGLLRGLPGPVDPAIRPAIIHWPDGALRGGKHVLRGARHLPQDALNALLARIEAM